VKQADGARYEGKKDIRNTSLPYKIIVGSNKVRFIFVNIMKTYINSGDMASHIHHIGTGWRCVVTIRLRPSLFGETSQIFAEFEADLVQKVPESFGADEILLPRSIPETRILQALA